MLVSNKSGFERMCNCSVLHFLQLCQLGIEDIDLATVLLRLQIPLAIVLLPEPSQESFVLEEIYLVHVLVAGWILALLLPARSH